MFEPVVVAFTCNWCGYPSANLAGVNRIQYPPNVRIIRVMCSGRIEPNFILDALEAGADGVIITGCLIDNCHYVSGNKRADEWVEQLKKVISTLGLGSKRLTARWIPASERAGFAMCVSEFLEEVKKLGPNPMKKSQQEKQAEKNLRDAVENLIRDTGAHDCVECGKCTSVCPVTTFKPDFAPRLLVVKALAGVEMEDLVREQDIWSCITCEVCNSMCPYKVDYSGFVRGMRTEAVRVGKVPDCSLGGLVQTIARIMTNTKIQQDRMSWVTEELKIAKKGKVFYFTGCLPYLDPIFNKDGVRLIEIARSAIRIMNSLGVTPVVSPAEKCCGHDLNWVGDETNLIKLMEHNVENIRKSGAETIIFTCPECYRTFKLDYQDFLGDLEFEMVHISEFLSKCMKDGTVSFTPTGKTTTITYHDPCRLGRHLGIYDPPREVLQGIPDFDLVEMERIREESACCGVSAWATCDSVARKMQINRMMEAKRTGASILLTSCPKCWIHLNCAISHELPVDKKLVELQILDFTSAIADILE
jgi:Fe-S oxidoreductase